MGSPTGRSRTWSTRSRRSRQAASWIHRSNRAPSTRGDAVGETIAFAWDVGGGVRQPFPSSSDPSTAIGGGEGAGWPTHSDRALRSEVSGSKISGCIICNRAFLSAVDRMKSRAFLSASDNSPPFSCRWNVLKTCRRKQSRSTPERSYRGSGAPPVLRREAHRVARRGTGSWYSGRNSSVPINRTM